MRTCQSLWDKGGGLTGDLLSNKESQDEYAKCATARGVLASITQRVHDVGYVPVHHSLCGGRHSG